MKTIYWASIFSALCLITSPGPCLAWDLEPSSSSDASISISSWDEAIQVEVAMAPSELSLLGAPADNVAGLLEPSASFHPIEDSTSDAQEDMPIQLALVNIPPKSSKPEEPVETIADPLEPINRVFFHFNDKFYFLILKPVASGYEIVVPEILRVGVRNFFSNAATPIRLVNCLLQANFKCVGTEIARFFLNTTFGVAGFFDPARAEFNIEKIEKDFGSTLGLWGIGPGFYVNWPIFGPSSLRDTVGFVFDLFLDPQNYLIPSIPINIAVKSYAQVNETSLTIGEYEEFKKSAIDPYIALKDAYHQYRQNKIKE